MQTRIRVAAVLFLVLMNLRAYGDLTTSTWTGGTSGPWGDPNNWSPATVPNNDGEDSFVVNINGIDPAVSIAIVDQQSVHSVNCNGPVNLVGENRQATLSLTGSSGLTNRGSLSLDQMAIAGQIKNAADATLTLGAHGVDLTGGISNTADGLIRAVGTLDIHGGTIANDGEIIFGDLSRFGAVSDGGVTSVTNAGILRFRGGSCAGFDHIGNQARAVIVGTGVVHAQQSIENAGIIYAFLGHLVVDSYGTLVNRGTLLNLPGSTMSLYTEDHDCVNRGTIMARLGGAITFVSRDTERALMNEGGGTILLKGGTISAPRLVHTAGASFSGFGGIDASLVIEEYAVVTLTGPTNIVGDVEMQNGARLSITTGDTLITDHVRCNGTIRLTGGTLTLQGGISGDYQIMENGGTYIEAPGAG